MSSLSVAGIGVLLLAAFGVLHFLRILATTRAVLAFCGTCALFGSAASGVSFVRGIVRWAASLVGSLGGWAFGSALAALGAVFIVLAAILAYDLHPHNPAGKRTGFIAIVVALMAVTGVTGFAAVNHLPSNVRQVVDTARTSGLGGK